MSLATAITADRDAIPRAYVLHATTTCCMHCATRVTHSEFYELHFLRSRMNGSPIRHLVPCYAPLYNLPVERVHIRRLIPFCADCETIDVSYLPPPPDAAQLHDLPGPSLREEKVRSPVTAKPAPHKATLGDLA